MTKNYLKVLHVASLTFVMLLGLVQNLFGQYNVQIGSGTATISNSTGIPVTNYDYTYSQQIVTAAEITAAGGGVGDILKLRYKLTTVGTVTNYDQWEVYVANTAITSFPTTTSWLPIGSLTQVFNGTIPTPTNNNWFDITFSAPFAYTGGNLVIAVLEKKVGWTGAPVIQSYTSTAGAAIMFRRDTTPIDPNTPPTATGTYSAVPQVQVQFALTDPPTPVQAAGTPNCLTGSDLTATATLAPNEVLYWQTSATGTSTANNAATPWTVFANGTYYLRTHNPTINPNAWSTASSVTVSNFPLATTPPAPTASVSPACLNSTMVAAAAPGGTTYYWQTAVNGTSNANDAATPLPVTATGDYYLAAFETATGCWSNTSMGSVVIQTIVPATPVVTATPTFVCAGGSSNLEVVPPAAPAYCTPTQGTTARGIANFVTTGTGTNISNATGITGYTNYSATQSATRLAGEAVGFTITGFNIPTETYGFAIWVDWNNDGTLAAGEKVFNTTGYVTDATGSFNVPAAQMDGTYRMRVMSHWLSANPSNPCEASATNIEMEDYALVVTGGTTYTWNPGALVGPTQTVSPLTTTNYTVTATYGVCTSAIATATVSVAAVDVTLVAVDETCIGYEDGTFNQTGVLCGDAPFTYSIDGGAFGAIPTDLGAGTYSVIVQDTDGDLSGAYSVVIGSASTVIPTDVLANPDEYFYCTSDVSVTVAAQGPFQSATCTTPVTNVSGNDNVITPTVTDFTCPTGTITGATLNAAYTGSFCGSWYWFDIEVNGNIVATDQCNTTTFDLTPYLPLTEVKVISKDHPNDGIIDFVTMNVSVTMEYDVVMPGATVAWYDAPTAGTQLGTSPSGAPFELIGTTVLPTNAAGSYPVYAVGKIGGCYSVNSTEVTATVSEVHQTFTIIDATCNNGDNGSFTPLTFECGSAPFSYSVDGGTFGTIPTNLTTGTHTVQVQDGGGELSAIYTITVGSADGPSDATVEAFSFDTAHVYWTPNGSETSWNIEWGPVGFTPGTGTQTGMANVADTFFTIIGLDGDTEYDIYVSADCGGTTTPGDWDMTSVQTTCDPVAILPFCESFESDSPTIQCWKVIDDNNDGTAWGLYNDPTLANTGDFAAAINTDFNNGANSDYLVMPMITLTGNEVLTFNYRTYSDFEPNDVQVLISTTGSNPADFQDTLLNLFTVGEEFYKDTMANLSAFTGNVYIAFNVPNGGLDGWILFIDDVCVDVCIPNPGTDGDIDVCRLDGTVDLDAVITSDYIDGSWIFPANQSVVNGSTLNVSTLAATSFDILYVKTTACTSDTTIATVNIFNESNAGNDGTLSVCRNEPVDLLSGITSGTIDLGGDWYNPSSQLLPSSAIVANNVPGQYNYTYITGNGVCPDDTSSIILNVSSTCDYLNVEEMVFAEMSVYPNPSNGIFNIANESSSVFSYEVLDVEGRLVERKEAAVGATSVTSIDMTGKVTGIYMIRVYNSEADKVFRVVLQ